MTVTYPGDDGNGAAETPVTVTVNKAASTTTVTSFTSPVKRTKTSKVVITVGAGFGTPGGTVTTGIALVLSVIAVIATFFVDQKAAGITALVFVAALAYFWFYSRHHLVHSAPEEEFAAIEEAESHLH